MDVPNLFSFATSELSQDAFVSWLLSWADVKYAPTNPELHKAGTMLLSKLFDLDSNVLYKPTAYKSVVVERQARHKDIVVKVNDGSSDFAVLIEDKTFTSQHSGQLEKYLSSMIAELPRERFAAVYFKTGDQSDYRPVKEAGYCCFGRADFLALLKEGLALGVKSNIFDDFFQYLAGIDEAVNGFRTCPITSVWDRNAWTGFFVEIKEQLGDDGGDWYYVSNPSGGFMGFSWNWKANDTKYLQLEHDKLCFKIAITDKSLRDHEWSSWHTAIETSMKARGMRPRTIRRHPGAYMTVASLDGDYRIPDHRGLVDLEKTVEVLRQAGEVLNSALGQDIVLR